MKPNNFFVFILLLTCFTTNCTRLQSAKVETSFDYFSHTFAQIDKPSFQIRTIRDFNEGSIVLFSSNDTSYSEGKLLGYATFSNKLFKKKSNNSGIAGWDTTYQKENPLIFYISETTFENIEREKHPILDYWLVYGEIFSPDIIKVELVLNNGDVLTDVEAQDVFVFLVPKSQYPCKLRLKGLSNTKLQEINILDVYSSPLLNCKH